MTKTFSSKSNAKRAATAELGSSAVEAEDYTVTEGANGRWSWDAVQKAAGDSPVADSRPRRHPRATGELVTSESGNGSARAEPTPPMSATKADTKQSRLIAMLRGADGATVDEIAAAFSWQKHTVRGAIAGALKKKLGLAVTSEKIDGRGRAYKIAD